MSIERMVNDLDRTNYPQHSRSENNTSQ